MFDEPDPIDEASKRKRRRRRWITALTTLAILGWPVILLFATGRNSTQSATRVLWDSASGTPVPADRFNTLAFPVTTSPPCAAALTGVNRAILMRLEEMEAPQVQVIVGGTPVSVSRSCVSFLPTTGTLKPLIDNLNAEIRSWGAKATDWLRVEAEQHTTATGVTEFRFIYRTDDHVDTFIYQTDGATVTPIRWEGLFGPAAMFDSAVILLLGFAIEFFVVVIVVLVRLALFVRRRVIGNRA